MEAALTGEVLAWERALLTAESLGQWFGIASDPPGAPRTEHVVKLLLADATFELRHLAAGNHVADQASSPLNFVESLVGLAPQLAALRQAWHGEFHAADHALLLPGTCDLRHLLMLPLQRDGQMFGVYCLATRAQPAALADVGDVMLAHVATVLASSLERLFDRARLLRGGVVDTLTGWNSGRFLYARLREEIARSQRRGGSVACLVVDVDRLQSVNDDFGQPAGDRVLREIALRIETQVRSSDTAARFGSDEFAVLMPDTEAVQGRPLAERILRAVRAAPIDVGGGLTRVVTVSIGIAGLRPLASVDRKT